jgi:2-polyprenyl-6-methoxyphenol hydroxylase-like FAD-dependent oxidoreductase
MKQAVWHSSQLPAVLEDCPELSKHLTHRATAFQKFQVTRSDTHVCDPPFSKNVVLIGDAAVSTHYSLGAGLLVALCSARELARCLKDASIEPNALQLYGQYVLQNLVPLHALADKRCQWFDNVAMQSKEHNESDLIGGYVEMSRGQRWSRLSEQIFRVDK